MVLSLIYNGKEFSSNLSWSTSEHHWHCSQHHFQGGYLVILWNTTSFFLSTFSVPSLKTVFLKDNKWDFKLINDQSCFSKICKLNLVGINHRRNCFLPFMSWYSMLAGTVFQVQSQLVQCTEYISLYSSHSSTPPPQFVPVFKFPKAETCPILSHFWFHCYFVKIIDLERAVTT